MQARSLLKKSTIPLNPGLLASRGLGVLIVLFWSALVVIPLLVLLSVALKSPADLLNNPLGWPVQFVWSNFADAWNNAALGQAFFNSVLITSVTLLGLILCGAMAAYPLARFTGPCSQRIYLYFVAGLIVPLQLGLFPLYKEMHDLQLINTYHGAILLYIAVNLPFVIFLYTGFIKTVPRELEEAALLDGAGPMRTFWMIVFPLLRPVTATVAITSALSTWNDFFIPLIFLQRDGMQTLPLAIFNFVGQYNNNWPLIFASVIISSLPLIVIFLILQRYFIKGIAAGALRG
ncbi:sugar ABC transporter permease [Reticulibacter mediterranei]|uniref:Sugar ABC transporter permease n=1 Tax=Reticulibacter mediterranei TaxID=2778369 RepID=A0A8J3IR21_9CHLR|nr:carbohydrate ABC transporter permease [Reticulibacter mediterranei]GHO96394.1 sugar ABC transporter permease [Reticulibacter mediterranei]